MKLANTRACPLYRFNADRNLIGLVRASVFGQA